jgi:hypothetical protein
MSIRLFLAPVLFFVIFLAPEACPASGELLVAYGGHNETMAPMLIEVCSESTASIREYCRPAAARS